MTFLNFLVNPIFTIFYDFFSRIYMKMFKHLSAKYYQKNQERLQKELMKDIKIFLEKKKKKK